MKVLVFGKTGQVATELAAFGGVTCLGRDQADLTDPGAFVAGLDCSGYEDRRPWVTGPRLSERRIAIVSTAALMVRSDAVFQRDAADYRVIPGISKNSILFTYGRTTTTQGRDSPNADESLRRWRSLPAKLANNLHI